MPKNQPNSIDRAVGALIVEARRKVAPTRSELSARKAMPVQIREQLDQHLIQSELARRIKLSPVMLGRYELGRVRITVAVLTDIAKALGCNLVDLLPHKGLNR